MNPKYIAISLLNEQYTKLSMTAIYNKINYVSMSQEPFSVYNWDKKWLLCLFKHNKITLYTST